jgi:hypothetical protein
VKFGYQLSVSKNQETYPKGDQPRFWLATNWISSIKYLVLEGDRPSVRTQLDFEGFQWFCLFLTYKCFMSKHTQSSISAAINLLSIELCPFCAFDFYIIYFEGFQLLFLHLACKCYINTPIKFDSHCNQLISLLILLCLFLKKRFCEIIGFHWKALKL